MYALADFQDDILGRRLKTEVDYKTFTSSHSYTYYRNGKKKSYTGPDGITHTYTYTPINLLRNITIQGVGKVSYLNYKWLKPEKITSPGMVREDTYDHFLRLTKRKTTAAGKTILDLSYEYNVLDNIISRKSGDTLTGYSYDDLQRLVQVDKNNQTQKTFTFDPVGNRLSTNKEPSYTYDANNQLLAVGETSYSYDKNGNTITKKSPQETSHFQYNFENRLSKVTKNGIDATYYYDPFGRRLSKTVNGKTTWFAYGDEGLIAEYDERGKITVSYGWQPGSTWSTDPILTSKAGKHYFYHNDHLGAPHNLTDTSGRVVWQGVYDVYGEVDVVKEEVDNKLRFPGQYFDKETGLYYNWNRYYDPKTGRYLNADPIGLMGGINMFAYVGGDPVNWFDPWGLYTLEDARQSLIKSNIKPEGQTISARGYTAQLYSSTQIFDEWLALEKSLGAWWKKTPNCPEKICVNDDGKAINPDSNTWSDPNVGYIAGLVLNYFHSGAVFEVRTLQSTPGSPHGNQCTYDSDGNLMKTTPAAGSADLYGPNNDFNKHQAHDVETYKLADRLGRVKDYYSVRPIW